MSTRIEFNATKIFEEDNRLFLFNGINNKIFEIDDAIGKMIHAGSGQKEQVYNVVANKMTKDKFEELIEDMRLHQVIKEPNQNYENTKEDIEGDITMISLLVAQDCNLRCSYCYADEGQYSDCGKMNFMTAKRAVDFLVNHSKSKDLTVCFFGGEPLINFKLIKEVVAYCRQIEKERGKHIGFTMTTNGTLITKEIEDYIRDNKFGVQISVDGDKETHDHNRYFANKMGSHEILMNKTSTLRADKRINARATVTEFNFDIDGIYEYLATSGFGKIAISPAFNLIEDVNLDKLADAYIEHYHILEDKIKNKQIGEVKSYKLFMQDLKKVHFSKERKVGCGVGRNLFTIDINGNIFPCQRFVDHKSYKLGDIWHSDHSAKAFLSKINVKHFEKCQGCWVKNLCAGGCVHNNLTSTGSLTEPSDAFCDYTKKIQKSVIEIYLRLSDDEISQLFQKN